MKTTLRIVIAAAVMGLAVPALAQSPTQGTFQVTATVAASCALTTNDLAFGTYYAQTPLTGQADLVVQCTNGTTYTVGIDNGLHFGAAPAPFDTLRAMANAGNTLFLGYELFSDGARTVAWGDTVATRLAPAAADGTAITHTIYGRVPAGQFLATPGAYTDATVTVSVYY